MPGEQIDDAALAEVAERDLGPDRPARGHEPPSDLLGHAGMAGCQKVGELPASPADNDVELELERAADAAQGVERHRPTPALDQGHRRRRDTSSFCDIGLSPAEAVANASNDAAHLKGVHRNNCHGARPSLGYGQRADLRRRCILSA